MCTRPASESPGVLVKMQVIGSYSRWREFYYLGVGLRIFPFRLFPRQFLNLCTDMSVPLPKASHLHSSCLSAGLSISHPDTSSCLLTSLPSSVSSLSATGPSSTRSAYAKSPWFPNSNSGLPVLWDLLSYPGSQPVSCPLFHSPNIPGPFPACNSTACDLPSASNAIYLLFTWETQTPTLSPDELRGLCETPLLLPASYSHRTPFISLLQQFHTLSGVSHTFKFICLLFPLALQRGSIVVKYYKASLWRKTTWLLKLRYLRDVWLWASHSLSWDLVS